MTIRVISDHSYRCYRCRVSILVTCSHLFTVLVAQAPSGKDVGKTKNVGPKAKAMVKKVHGKASFRRPKRPAAVRARSASDSEEPQDHPEDAEHMSSPEPSEESNAELGAKTPESDEEHVQVEQSGPWFKRYDLSILPEDAFPDPGKANRGSHGYTLTSQNGASVEVLLSKEAFFVKKAVEPGSGPTGHLAWAKLGTTKKAWRIAKARSGFVRDFDRYQQA